ncbi:MAG: hypothetical protein AAF587_22770 [Bacteroidota bacterium]
MKSYLYILVISTLSLGGYQDAFSQQMKHRISGGIGFFHVPKYKSLQQSVHLYHLGEKNLFLEYSKLRSKDASERIGIALNAGVTCHQCTYEPLANGQWNRIWSQSNFSPKNSVYFTLQGIYERKFAIYANSWEGVIALGPEIRSGTDEWDIWRYNNQGISVEGYGRTRLAIDPGIFIRPMLRYVLFRKPMAYAKEGRVALAIYGEYRRNIIGFYEWDFPKGAVARDYLSGGIRLEVYWGRTRLLTTPKF